MEMTQNDDEIFLRCGSAIFLCFTCNHGLYIRLCWRKNLYQMHKCVGGGGTPPTTFGLRWASTSIMYHEPKIVNDEVYTTTIRATVTWWNHGFWSKQGPELPYYTIYRMQQMRAWSYRTQNTPSRHGYLEWVPQVASTDSIDEIARIRIKSSHPYRSRWLTTLAMTKGNEIRWRTHIQKKIMCTPKTILKPIVFQG